MNFKKPEAIIEIQNESIIIIKTMKTLGFSLYQMLFCQLCKRNDKEVETGYNSFL